MDPAENGEGVHPEGNKEGEVEKDSSFAF